jgi:hypothetical protein
MDKLIFTTNYREESPSYFQDTRVVGRLERVDDSVILTRQQLEKRDRKIAGDAWEACVDYYNMGKNRGTFPNKEQYLSSLFGEKAKEPDKKDTCFHPNWAIKYIGGAEQCSKCGKIWG